MYDVLYLNHTNGEKLLASGLQRQDACEVARTEARRRGVGLVLHVVGDDMALG